MKNKNQEFTWPVKIMLMIFMGIDMMPRSFENKTRYTKRLLSGKLEYWSYYQILKRLERGGYITIHKDQDVIVPELTEEGRLKVLFEKARMSPSKTWKGIWTMVIFDIPEKALLARRRMRLLLKQNGFKLIQKSVYISPWELNESAVDYLRMTKLDTYIRIFRVQAVDKLSDLKNLFDM